MPARSPLRIVPRHDPVDASTAEPSARVTLRVVPFPAPQPTLAVETVVDTPPTRLSRLHVVFWPVVGAALTALGMVALRDTDEPSVVAPPAAALAVETPADAIPSPPVEPRRAVEPAPIEPAPAPEPALTPPSEPTPSPEAVALRSESITSTADYLVYTAPERPRDWYAAMNLCRGRAHADLDGWTTPTSRQLHALAKARVLPEAPLWSRTRSARSADLAFVVDGRAGTLRSTEKTEPAPAAVCVRSRPTTPEVP